MTWRSGSLRRLELESGDLLIIHAMKMRKVYHAEYKRLLPWSGS